MKIAPINAYSNVNYAKKRVVIRNQSNPIGNQPMQPQVSFRGDRGALKGMFAGALIGLGAVAVTVATGGLGAAVAAAGLSTVAAGGAGLGAQIGGIVGGLLEKDSDNKKD